MNYKGKARKHMNQKGTRKFELPDTIVILIGMILIATCMTWFVPSGMYDRIEDPLTQRMVVDPASFHYIDQTPVGLWDMLLAVPDGIVASANIIVLTLISGAAFHIINQTGAIDAGLGTAMKKLQGGKVYIMLFGIMALGALLGLRGSAESLLPFIPLGVAAAMAMGFDSITGVALMLVGGIGGYSVSFIDSAFIIGQGIAGLPAFSGIPFRMAAFAALTLPCAGYLYLYCRRLQRDPKSSSMYEADKNLKLTVDSAATPELTGRRKAVLLIFCGSFVVLFYGIFKLNFNVRKITAMYFALAVIAGVAGGFSMNEFAKHFVDGAKSMMYGVLAVGLARVISEVLTNGNILDTITYTAAGVVGKVPGWASASGMFVVQMLLNILIPSGSGQAAVTMPIMAPLADLVGVTRQTAVLAFQMGDSITNFISPTVGYFMAAIAIGNIPWLKWAKWVTPLLLFLALECCVILSIATMIGYGPF